MSWSTPVIFRAINSVQSATAKAKIAFADQEWEIPDAGRRDLIRWQQLRVNIDGRKPLHYANPQPEAIGKDMHEVFGSKGEAVMNNLLALHNQGSDVDTLEFLTPLLGGALISRVVVEVPKQLDSSPKSPTRNYDVHITDTTVTSRVSKIIRAQGGEKDPVFFVEVRETVLPREVMEKAGLTPEDLAKAKCKSTFSKAFASEGEALAYLRSVSPAS